MSFALPPFHFAIQMWGKNYTEPFTKAVLPLLLSPGNLPAINLSGSVFDIYTTSEDLPVINACQAFKRLESLLPVEIELIDDLDRSQSHAAMSKCHRRAIEKSDLHGRIIVFLQPDTCVSDSTLKNMERVLREGKRVVQVAGFRTRLEKMLPELESHYDPETTSITLSGRQLIGLAQERLHPISESCLWDSDHFTSYTAHIYWRIGKEGFFARCAHLHPLAVWPRMRNVPFDFTIDYNYFDRAVPDFEDYYVTTDSDEMLMCEMSRESHFVGTQGRNKASAFQIAKWMGGHTTEKHRRFFSSKIYFHTGNKAGAEWQKVADFSDAVLKEAFCITNHSLSQLAFTRYFLPILAERTRLYYYTKKIFHSSDKIIVATASYGMLAFKLLKKLVRYAKRVSR